MIPVLLIAVPFLSGVLSFFIKSERSARMWSLGSSVITLAITLVGLFVADTHANLYSNIEWMGALGSSFSVGIDGMGKIVCLLTAVSYPVIFTAVYHHGYSKPNSFYGLMLLMQAGLMGVFVSFDALLFYFFWELALIPAYFLCSIWGGEKRIAV
ncbi:MAG: NADH-quinone oxidoreductase subunit M, partial [Flavitalea sp.]